MVNRRKSHADFSSNVNFNLLSQLSESIVRQIARSPDDCAQTSKRQGQILAAGDDEMQVQRQMIK